MWPRLFGALLLVLVSICAFVSSAQAAVIARPYVQAAPVRLTPPFITPLEPTTVTLLTHTVDFTFAVADPATGGLTMQMDATYRLANERAESVALTLKIAEPNGAAITGVTAAADDIPLTLFETAGLGYTAQLQLGADSRTTVTLRYLVDLPELPLPLLAYPAATLAAWPGAPSLRVTVTVPADTSPESWLHIAPAGWHYAEADGTLPGVKWLYDAQIPTTPFVFEFIHPTYWAQLQQAAAAATTDATMYRALGDQYMTLVKAVPLTPDYATVRSRFYSQALAAYTTGIAQLTAAGRTGHEIGALYAAQAALYRAQVAQPDGRNSPAYATAMIDAAQQALAQLPDGDPQRAELNRWVADGLQATLTAAQAAEDWGMALATIEQLAALPPELVDRAILERTRHTITVRQALQLLEADNRTAALALAGSDLLDEQLLPPVSDRTLFRRWEITTTITPSTIDVTVLPLTTSARYAPAHAAFAALVDKLRVAADPALTLDWQATASAPTPASTATVETADHLAPVGHLHISAPTNGSFASLTTAIPALAEWSLLYTVLRQLQPTMTEQPAGWLRQTTQLQLALDLQPVATDWQQVARNLDAQAVALEADAGTRNARDAAEAESALRARIQAANYRTTAQEWRALLQDSRLFVELSIPVGLQQPSRAWLLTPQSPTQLVELTSAPSYVSAFISVAAVSLGLILLLSGLLWWLL